MNPIKKILDEHGVDGTACDKSYDMTERRKQFADADKELSRLLAIEKAWDKLEKWVDAEHTKCLKPCTHQELMTARMMAMTDTINKMSSLSAPKERGKFCEWTRDSLGNWLSPCTVPNATGVEPVDKCPFCDLPVKVVENE